MAKRYIKIGWENKPSVKTPVNMTNLGRMDKGIDDLDLYKIDTDAIANNLVTTEAGLVLDARQGKVLDDKVNTINNNLARVEFICTPLTGYKIVESKCYVINKVAYLEIAVRKIDDTAFATGLVSVATVPHVPTASTIALSSLGLASGGTSLETKITTLQRWDKTLSLNVAVANVVTLIISGQYLID